MKKVIFEKLVIMNTFFNVFLVFSIFVGGVVWADTNGVWHRAEDVIAGVFGGDEGQGNFTFPNKLTVKGILDLDSDIECTNCISNTNIKPGNVNSQSIADGSINAVDLNAGSVTSDKLNLNNGLVVKAGDANIAGKVVAGELCLGAECHSNLESLCNSWVAKNAIN